MVSSAKGSVAIGLEVSRSITPWGSLGIRSWECSLRWLVRKHFLLQFEDFTFFWRRALLSPSCVLCSCVNSPSNHCGFKWTQLQLAALNLFVKVTRAQCCFFHKKQFWYICHFVWLSLCAKNWLQAAVRHMSTGILWSKLSCVFPSVWTLSSN